MDLEIRKQSLMSDSEYSMSFIAGGLFLIESTAVAEAYLHSKNWDEVKTLVSHNNKIQAKTRASLDRYLREIVLRLRQLNDLEIELLVKGSTTDRRQLLWISACRKHRFIREFAVEVIREKHLHFQPLVTHKDFDMFFNQKADWHPELDKLTMNTLKKIRQVLFRMLKEAEIIMANDIINNIYISKTLAKTLGKNSQRALTVFPLTDEQIRKITE
ncbi:MAG: DUF1819 family protein [Moraxellaceae bacterium]|nr:DUF1819 family protein [Pseudobdellovibrionaceae bacterium]